MRRRGHRVPHQRQRRRRTCGRRVRAEFDARRAGRWCRRHARDLPIPGRELAGVYQAMEYLPCRTACRKATSTQPPITRRGQARGDHRRRRHRRRLPRHRRTARARRRCTSSRSCPARPTTRVDDDAVADVPDDLPRVVGARRGWRARLRGQHRVLPRRRRRQPARAARARGGADVRRRPDEVREDGRHRLRAAVRAACCSRWASSARSARACSSNSASSSTSAATCARDAAFTHEPAPSVFVGRRHGPRSEPHRVGDRRGPLLRAPRRRAASWARPCCPSPSHQPPPQCASTRDVGQAALRCAWAW